MDVRAFPALQPELEPYVAQLADPTETFLEARTRGVERVSEQPLDLAGVSVERFELRAWGSPARVTLYRSNGPAGPRPALLFIHGGGFCLPATRADAALCAQLAREAGVAVFSVDYRLAPEHPYPAGFDHCCATLKMMVARPDLVCVDRVGVLGHAEGGALAAGLALWARDAAGPAIRWLSLDSPALDDRLATDSMNTSAPTIAWGKAPAASAWRAYLQGVRADAYAAPSRARRLSGLPQVRLTTSSLDPLRDEVLAFAVRLMAQGVSADLHCYCGVFHGARGIAPGTGIAQRISADIVRDVRVALCGHEIVLSALFGRRVALSSGSWRVGLSRGTCVGSLVPGHGIHPASPPRLVLKGQIRGRPSVLVIIGLSVDASLHRGRQGPLRGQ